MSIAVNDPVVRASSFWLDSPLYDCTSKGRLQHGHQDFHHRKCPHVVSVPVVIARSQKIGRLVHGDETYISVQRSLSRANSDSRALIFDCKSRARVCNAASFRWGLRTLAVLSSSTSTDISLDVRSCTRVYFLFLGFLSRAAFDACEMVEFFALIPDGLDI